MKKKRDTVSESGSDDERNDFPDDDSDSPNQKMRRNSYASESDNQEDIFESPNRNRSVIKGNFFMEDLSSDDEVYTFQCPTDFSVETLLKVNVDLNEVTQIKEKSGEVFNMKLLESESKTITCAMPSKKKEGTLAVIPLVGHIIIQKDTNIPDVNLNRGEDDDKVAYPTDLKVRHPLLGANWENYLYENVKKRKRNHDESSPKKKHKRENIST